MQNTEDRIQNTEAEQATLPEVGDSELRAILEAIVYVTDEPLSARQIAAALNRPPDQVEKILGIKGAPHVPGEDLQEN